MQLKCFFAVFFLSLAISIYARPVDGKDKRLEAPPPRIIRTCCSFGVDVRMTGIPFVRYNDITGRTAIGPHKFLGQKQEGNGIIYTRKGGFVDIGHLRDQADWTAYLYDLIKKNQQYGQSILIHKLGYEGGPKLLKVAIPSHLTEEDIMIISGRIAYDLSVWHEIGTWNGTSYIPMLPERYSAFSIEDGYSNLLGIKLGIQALKSDLPYEEAMTQLISEQLDYLEALPEKSTTHNAMMLVEGDWWSQREKLPSGRVIKKRDFNLYPCVYPTLLSQYNFDGEEGLSLCLPELPLKGDPNQFYRIEIQLNNKFPVKNLLPHGKKRMITQKDFAMLISYAQIESDLKYGSMIYKASIIKPKNNQRKKTKI